MKKFFSLITIAVVCLCINAKAQDDQAAMKKWMDYMTPGDMQKELAKSEGEWETETTVWMAPNTPPMTSKGTCTNKMIMGGRFLESKHTSTFMNMPFEGVGTYGYDNAKKVFWTTWIDNMGTGMMHLEGTWDDGSQSVIFTGSMVEPTTGADQKIKETHKIIDDNNQLMEMFTVADGKETKTMEVKFKRK